MQLAQNTFDFQAEGDTATLVFLLHPLLPSPIFKIAVLFILSEFHVVTPYSEVMTAG